MQTFGEVSFEGSSIKGTIDFSNRIFSQQTNFKDVKFRRSPKFYNAKLHQNTNFLGATFGGFHIEDASQDYRTLKLEMEEKRARREEMIFYYCEQCSRWFELWRVLFKNYLLNLLFVPMQILFSSFHFLFNAYGRSYVLPLAWFVVLQVGAYFMYWSLPGCDEDLIGFTMQQVTRPFGIWSPDSEETDIAVRAWATGHSVVSLTVLYLFLQSLRRSFKVG